MNATNQMTTDGNTAAAHVAYALSDAAAIYPITPSTTMAELCDQWAAAKRKNIFGQTMRIAEMQSEAGAAGAVHGSLAAGALTTTFTASQGLLLMIPNMYKIAGELLPCVFHVTARTVATHALSIFGDHSDVMACRQTGFAMLSSASVQEAMDLAAVAHMATLKCSVPFLHFFDGFRTSHEVQKIDAIPYETLNQLVDHDAIAAFRARAMNPEHPHQRGTAQNPDVFFQNREACNPYYQSVPEAVQQAMDDLARAVGRQYHLFEYYGAPDADRAIVILGSGAEAAEETIDYLAEQGEKVGVIKVHLYRPFSAEHFLAALPATVKAVAVMDRTKEPGAYGEPLYQDVATVLQSSGRKDVTVVGGRYGLASKEFTPSMIYAIYQNLAQPEPKNHFTVGINDDVTKLSLPITQHIDTTPAGTTRCKFYGLGADGTVGANKNAIKIIGDHTDLYVQGYFEYDSKKSGSVTVSHLRFGKQPIKAPYLLTVTDFVACHNPSYLTKFDMLNGLREGGVFLLNAPWATAEELEPNLPAHMKQAIAQKKLKVYTIDAIRLGREIGLGGRINMIMSMAFFKVTDILPVDETHEYMRQAIRNSYGRKGEKIVNMNYAALDAGMNGINEIHYPDSWADAKEGALPIAVKGSDYFEQVARPILAREGDKLPVSAFAPDGRVPMGTTKYEKRGIADNIPNWLPQNCIQCNQCSYVCPHAVIRPFLSTKEADEQAAPDTYVTLSASGKRYEGYQFRIQVSPFDCTGCGNCADICPAKEKALVMQPFRELMADAQKNWDYASSLPEPDLDIPTQTVKDSQFHRPLFEFHGACAGCGETPYLRLTTQLFGDRMIIANATGCTSIYGGSNPTTPYTVNGSGCGPAWANSLFEDNAEFGYGFYLAFAQRRDKLKLLIQRYLDEPHNEELAQLLHDWLDYMEDSEESAKIGRRMKELLPHMIEGSMGKTKALLEEINRYQDMFIKKSIWMFGGDGWAYDIGYGGLDHVIASGEDVNILIVDTEVYSNTGGQSSKATPTGAIAKFAAEGKKIKKKDLGLMAMSYGYVYVASVSMGANHKQLLDALHEAESYHGPSVILAFATCISHGLVGGMGKSQREEQSAVTSGYWPLYRYDPRRAQQGENPFQLDSKEPTMPVRDFLMNEVRYSSLMKQYPEQAEELFTKIEREAKDRLEYYQKMAQ